MFIMENPSWLIMVYHWGNAMNWDMNHGINREKHGIFMEYHEDRQIPWDIHETGIP